MDFMSILNTRAGEIEKPMPLPVGTYVWKVNKAHKQSQTGQGAWDVIEFPIVAVRVDEDADDIDADDLEKFGNLNQAVNRISFMFSTDSANAAERARTAHNLKQFLLNTLRVDGSEDSTIKELLAAAIGCEFRAQASHRTAPDGENVYVDVKNWMPLAD